MQTIPSHPLFFSQKFLYSFFILTKRCSLVETRDIIFSIVMVIAAFVLTFRWITRFSSADPLIIISAMILIGALAAILLSIEFRLKKMEQEIRDVERGLRVNIQSMEMLIESRSDRILNYVTDVIEQLQKRIYR